MKKTYQKPTVEVMLMEMQQMIAQSPQSLTRGDAVESASGAETKRRGIFSGDSEGSGSIW